MTHSHSTEAGTPLADKDDKFHPVTVVFDDDPLPLPDHKTTPNAMLALVGLALATHYVVRLKGRERESLQGRGDDATTVHDKERFVSVSTEPTPTS